MVDLVPDGKKLGWLIEDEDQAWIDSLEVGTPFTYGDYQPIQDVLTKPSEWLRIEDQNGFGSCFPAGTKVTLANGELKNIEDIKFGEYVLTHKRQPQPVIDTMRRDYTGDMITVFAKGWGKISMTEDHVVRVIRSGCEKWVKAGELKDDDLLIVSHGPREHSSSRVDISGYLRISGVYDDGEYISANGGNQVKRDLELTDEVCWVIGLYVAEGSISFSASGNPDRAVWTIHEKEESACLEKIKSFAEQIGANVRTQSKKDSKALNIIIDGSIVADFLSNVCGRFCNKKKVPEFILRGTESQKMEFARGYYFGDGSDRKYGGERVAASGNKVRSLQVHAATASRVLAQQLSTLLVSLGMRPGRTRTRKRSHQTHPSYQTYLYSKDAVKLMGDNDLRISGRRFEQECESGQARKIRTITRKHVDLYPVYDFTVAEDHSFVAQGLVVHNCQGNALSTVCEIAYYNASKGDITQLSRWFAYIGTQHIDGIRGDQGSTIGGGAELAKTRGICPEELYPYPTRYTYTISQAQYEAAKPYRLKTARRMETVDDVRNWLDGGMGGINIGVRWGGGGHAVAIVETEGSSFKVANSWGTSWGDNGYFTWTEREMSQKLRDNYTVAIGLTDMEEIKPREYEWSMFA